MTGKLDDISLAIGQIQSDIKTLFKRADEDRAEQDERHKANQDSMGETRQATQKAIAELRDAIGREVRAAIASAPPVTPMSRTRLAVLASIGLVTLWLIGRMIEAGLSWVIEHFLNMKFGG